MFCHVNVLCIYRKKTKIFQSDFSLIKNTTHQKFVTETSEILLMLLDYLNSGWIS